MTPAPAVAPAPRKALADVFRCTCGGTLAPHLEEDGIACSCCGHVWPVHDGIAGFIATDARTALDDIDYDAVYRIDAAASLAFARTYLDLLGARLPDPVESFLEIGAGTGQFTLGFLHAKTPKRAVVTDISADMLKACRRRLLANGIADDRLIFATWDGAQCLAPGAHDMVAGFSVLHHVLDVPAMLCTLSTALAPGGVAVFLEPNFRFHLAMVEMLCEVLVSVQQSDAWTAADRQHLADWLFENNTNLRFRGDERVLAGREDKHLFDGDQLRDAAHAAGFDAIELIAVEDETFSALEVYSQQMRLSAPARADLLVRYTRLLPGAYGHVASEDLSASTLIVLSKAHSDAVRAPWRPHAPARRVPSLDAPGLRCDLRLRVVHAAEDGADDAAHAVGLWCQGWVLGDTDAHYVCVAQAGRKWLFPVHRHRPDVQSGLNATRGYPLRRALFSGVEHLDTVPGAPAGGTAIVGIVLQSGETIDIATVVLEPATGESVNVHA